MAYPGTFSLRVSTLLDVLDDLVRSAHRHGFKRILIVNGHGGNDPARVHLYEVASDLPDLRLAWYSWWQSPSVQSVAMKYELKSSHANWMESFPFTRVSDLPAEAKVPPHVPGLLGASEARRVYGDGTFGGAYQAEPHILEEIFSAALGDILALLRFE